MRTRSKFRKFPQSIYKKEESEKENYIRNFERMFQTENAGGPVHLRKHSRMRSCRGAVS